jgi:alkaline phosphatase
MKLRLLAALAATLVAASTASAQTIYPIDRATILAGAHFDFKVEFAGVVQASALRVTINGQDYAQTLGGQGQLIEREDGEAHSSLLLRDVAIAAPGRYEVVATDGTNRASVTWEVYGTPGPRRARNVILFIGDGMSVGHVTAARILSRGIREGRYNSPLTIDQFPQMAMIGTSGVDSVVTDSANAAHAYTTGHKSSVNALGVYASRARSNTDHPRVETITSIVQRRHNMAVGVVTNTEIEDATPASMWAHTRRRSDYDIIVGQLLDAHPDVIMGGGSSNFIPRTTPGSRRADELDYIARFRGAGYGLATTGQELAAVAGDAGTRRLLGLFHPRNMDGALDRFFLRPETERQFPNQPDLTEEVRAALQVLSRNDNGFFLMVESGLIDKYSHPLDWERAVYDTIMLDNAVRVAVDWAGNRNDTLIIVVPDHTHGIGIIGTVDDNRPGEDMRERIGVYQDAGYPNYPAADEHGYPPRVDVSRRLAIFFNNFPDYYETFRPHLEGTNVPAIQGANRLYAANERYRAIPGALLRTGVLPRNADTGVHTADDVVLRAMGPGSEMAHGFMENTEVFRLIANALALAPR